MVKERGLRPNNITLSCMLDALISAGCTEEAYDLFEAWSDEVLPNTVSCSTMLKGFAWGASGALAPVEAAQWAIRLASSAYVLADVRTTPAPHDLQQRLEGTRVPRAWAREGPEAWNLQGCVVCGPLLPSMARTHPQDT